MSWYALQAPDDLDEHLLEDCWRLCRDLTCSAGDAGHGCAIFERLSGDQRTFFFAPAVGLLASKLGAEPCRKPSPDGLFLVHGETGAWRAHFSQTDRAQSDLFESTYWLAL